ncbi:hypothetical protein PHMEG_00013266, partial [Phytophthora megakarya]
SLVRPVKTCIDPELLEVLCLYERQKAIVDVASEELVALIDERLGFVKNEQVPDLDDVFHQHLKVDLHEDDILLYARSSLRNAHQGELTEKNYRSR